jgi:hypothetical protein
VICPPSHFPPLTDVSHRNFVEELSGLLDEIDKILRDGDNDRIDDVLNRLKVGNTPVNTRFSFYSASQTYNGLDNVQQSIVQNFKDALVLRQFLYGDDYLMDVVRESAFDGGAFSHVYKGRWKGKQVAVKKFRAVKPPVFLIPSDTIRCLNLNNLQEHIEGRFKVNKWHLFRSQHPCLSPNTLGKIYGASQGILNLLIRLGSLTPPNNLAGRLVLPRAGSMENVFEVPLCVAPARFYNVAGPGRNGHRPRPGFASG